MQVTAEKIALAVSARRKFVDLRRLHVIFLRVSQFLTWPIAYVYFNLLYRLHINGRNNFKKVSSPFIIVANHVNFLDSFLFRLILGFSTPHLPLRFTGVRRFNWRLLNFLSDIGVIGFVYDLFGVLTIIPGLGLENNLEESKRVLKDGGNVVIYPEGKIATTEEMGTFKPGAAVLAIGAGAPVILVSFKIEPSRFFRSSLTVNIGEPMKVPTGMGTDNVTKMFRDGILALYSKKEEE